MYDQENAGSRPKTSQPGRKQTLGSFIEKLEVIERRLYNSIKEGKEISNRLQIDKDLTEKKDSSVNEPDGALSRIDQLLDSIEIQVDSIQKNVFDIGSKLGFNE